MYKSVFARVVICSMFLAISAFVILAQDAAKTDHHPDFLQIITPHEGVDFTGFSADLVQVIKRNWWAKMSSETKQKLDRGLKGRVVVGFGIQRDGQLSNVQKLRYLFLWQIRVTTVDGFNFDAADKAV